MFPELDKVEKELFRKFEYGEEEFLKIIQTRNLDKIVKENPDHIVKFKDILISAFSYAYKNKVGFSRAHLFIQRILYYINRLKIFWFDKLDNYINEDSFVIFEIKSEIERQWAFWENSQIEIDYIKTLKTGDSLRERVKEDLNPLLGDDQLFIRNNISIEGYKRLLAITSLDGLVEASQLSRTLGGMGGEVQLILTKILWEEYGCGKLSNKHSSFFIDMLNELDMKTEPEAYFDVTPWEVLANINHSFYLSDKKQNYLRYVGGLLYTEVSAPSGFINYLKAGERIGLSKKGTGYWSVHIKEDVRHGQLMLNEAALPLATQFKDDSWQIIWGYDQQKFINSRATKSIANSIRELKAN
tara:strand:+ start:505 stop:1572 length:1068 start_codon:yes stop_codon:yes gene_type:complete